MLTIALALGANTALFGVIYAILIQPLPFRDPGKLVRIWNTHPTLSQLQLTVPDFVDIASSGKELRSDPPPTPCRPHEYRDSCSVQGEPEIVHAAMATNSLFSTMGIQPLTGRGIHGSRKNAKSSPSHC